MIGNLNSHFVKADSIHTDSDRVSWQHFLRRNLIRDCPQVNTRVLVNAWQDEKQARTRSSAFLQSSKSEYDCSLIFLDNFDTVTEREGKSDNDQEHGDECKDQGSKSWYVLIIYLWHKNSFPGVSMVNVVIIFLHAPSLRHCQSLQQEKTLKSKHDVNNKDIMDGE